MGKFIDITGEKFGRWTVLKRAENKQEPSGKFKIMWLCQCDCGNEVVVSSDNLRRGVTQSCGCYMKEQAKKNNTKHECSHTRLYKSFHDMKQRCNNPKNERYADYGGRGIAVCSEWLNSFITFKKWALDSGYNENVDRNDCTIDRIDVNGDYSPSNCRWASIKEQNNNRRNNRMITYEGRIQTLAKWCEELELVYNLTLQRIDRDGWSVERAFETPIKSK